MQSKPEADNNVEPKFRKFEYDKLVRVKILDRMVAEGSRVKFNRLSGTKLTAALIKKIEEEAIDTYVDLRTEDIANVAQYQALVAWKLEENSITLGELIEVQDLKRERDGGFSAGVFIETLEIASNNPWTAYLAEHPDQYPEIPAS